MHFANTLVVTLSLLAAQCNARTRSRTRTSRAATKIATTSAVASSQTPTFQNTTTAAATTVALDPNVLNCFVTLPANPLTAAGLSTPFLLNAPCSQTVATQQAFAEAAIYDPATGSIRIYHPLISDAGKTVAAAPVVPVIPDGAVVALWFGFNGGVLQLLDSNGQDANNSPILKGANCVNGLPGTQGDVFGQVSWCNSEAWFAAANAGIASGKTVIPDLGVDSLGNACPTSRSFTITDACPSDNVPTQYLLLPNGQIAQDTAANRAANPTAVPINNASDEALLTNILDPLIGCTPYTVPSLTDPGANVPALALSELQASAKQQAPIGLVPINDPDCLLTASGNTSIAKTNAYRLGVNQPIVAAGADDGALVPYCQNMVAIAPSFLKGFETIFVGQGSPAPTVGNNLFTFLANRYLMSLMQLTCPPSAIPFQPVVCTVDGNGAATSCVITLTNGTTASSAAVKASTSVQTSATATSVASVVHAVTALTTSAPTLSSAVAVVSTPSLSLAATTSTKQVVIEVVTFFVFFLSLGSPAPGVLPNGNGAFLVLEEVFIDIPSAANAACTHQFNACAAFAGPAFKGTDCLNQMNQCQGAASTASATDSTPGTLTQTATVPKSVTVSGTGTKATIVGVVQTAGAAASSIQAAACPAKRDVTISQCTATSTLTVFASQTPSVKRRHGHGHFDFVKA